MGCFRFIAPTPSIQSLFWEHNQYNRGAHLAPCRAMEDLVLQSTRFASLSSVDPPCVLRNIPWAAPR